jgi:protein Tex
MIQRIANILNLNAQAVSRVIELLKEGATIPFISRYRKEASGGMDEVQIMAIRDEWERQEEIEKRQATILKAIEEQGKLTEELADRIKTTFDLNLLEDIYLPYKKKRQTRAQKAREKGLEPLADLIWEQKIRDIEKEAEKFINDQVFSKEEALEGARDIIAERVNEHEKGRSIVREHFEKRARLVAELVKDKEKEAANYKDYFEFDKPLNKVQPHQLLAILRAESEGFLRFNLAPNEEFVLQDLDGFFIRRNCPEELEEHLLDAVEDAYKRLMRPSISTEFLNAAKEKADDYSIHIFAENLRQLLLASPLGSSRILALDPGFASGCKLVCLSETGDLLEHTIIYPNPPQNRTLDATHKLQLLVEKHNVETIAVGNGTAGRETEAFVRGLKFGDRKITIFLVNESGASIYSASEIGRKEFPNEDLTVRGAVSIGRRLMDPLAELVKIDPKSIGVGQYQHDVDQRKLQHKLNAVVESCVNAVGIDLNTASEYLLTYVSGLGPSLAHNIVEYRKINGAFKSRKELMKVARLGDKAFEQAAGFLRIRQAKNPLDNTAVHPEAYQVVEKMAKDLNCKVDDLIKSSELRKKIELRQYANEKIGLPTLHDIMKELEKPGLDPREARKAFEFANIHNIEDLREGMKLPGIVTNIAAFGAFVDIGIKQNGLIHKSKMSHKFIQDPNEVLKLGQELEVTIVSIDIDRDRIQLSLID